MNNQLIGALDIGTYKTKFLISSLDDKNFIKIHSKKTVHTKGIKKGNITDIDKLIDIINSCVGQAEDEIKSEIEKIYVSLNSIRFNHCNLCQSRNIGSYEIHHDHDVQNMINNAVNIFYLTNKNQKIIHLLKSCFKLDKKNIVENPVNLKAHSLETELGIISVEKNFIENLNNVFDKCHLNVEKFIYSPFASSILSADQEEFEKGFVHLDFGHDKTSVAIFDKGNLIHSSILPVGSWHITSDISKAFNLNYNLAEKIKVDIGLVFNNDVTNINLKFKDKENNLVQISEEMLKQVIQSRVDEILEMIEKEIKFSKIFNKGFIKIIISGGGSNLKGISNRIKKLLNCDVTYAKHSFPIKNTEFNIFSDYMVCLGITKLVYFNFNKEILGFKKRNKGFFRKLYDIFS